MYKNVLIHRLRPLLLTLFRVDLPPYHFSLCFFSSLRLPVFCCLVGFLEIVVLNRWVTGIYACNARTHQRLSRACLHVGRYNAACFARNVTGKCFCFPARRPCDFRLRNGNNISYPSLCINIHNASRTFSNATVVRELQRRLERKTARHRLMFTRS